MTGDASPNTVLPTTIYIFLTAGSCLPALKFFKTRARVSGFDVASYQREELSSTLQL